MRRRLTAYIVIIFILIVSSILYAFQYKQVDKLDVVAVNDIVQTITFRWEDVCEGDFKGLDYDIDYVVLDHQNQIVFTTKSGLTTDINSAIANRDTIMDIVRQDRVIGKVIIYNEASEVWINYRNQLVSYLLIVVIILACFFILYVYYLEKIIFHPFNKLKEFATRVALGDLDFPLTMDKKNGFGAFTESFDLMREELKKSRESERAANQSKKELVASLSHDIKTPIASIKAVVEVLQVKTKEEYITKQLNIIATKADQINSLITNMFTATLEELQELKVDVTEQSSVLLYNIIQTADYNNQVTISNKAECIILVDELRISQVIDNIIGNSYKYAGTSIHVLFQIKDEFLEITFLDYGMGVSKEEEKLIFHKFYRASNASNKSGTGLGLYISKYLMEKMLGGIECEKSTEGFAIKIRLRIA